MFNFVVGVDFSQVEKVFAVILVHKVGDELRQVNAKGGREVVRCLKLFCELWERYSFTIVRDNAWIEQSNQLTRMVYDRAYRGSPWH